MLQQKLKENEKKSLSSLSFMNSFASYDERATSFMFYAYNIFLSFFENEFAEREFCW